MSTACPRAPELTRFLDGEVTENRATELRTHLGECGACAGELDAQRRLVARIGAPIPASSSHDGVEALMRRLDAADAPVPQRPAFVRLLRPLVLLASATAAVLLAFALLPRGAQDRREFSARGAAVEWSRKVGVELWALEGSPRRLASGDRLTPGVALVASFSNVDAAPAYLLAFALDAREEVHWLYPAFLDGGSDPASVRLDASSVQRALPESVVLEDVAPGPLRLLFVVTRKPLRVSSIEAAAVTERSPSALRARWPEARVDELTLTFIPPSPAAP